MSRLALGALVGLGAGAALWLLTGFVTGRRRPHLRDRIGPYVDPLRASVAAGRARPATQTGAAALVLAFARRDRDDRRTTTRLARAGSGLAVADYRLEQLAWAAIGACIGAAVGVGLAARGASPATVGVLGATGAAAGVLARDQALARAAARRQRAIEAALPTLADLVALCVSSGTGPVEALERAATCLLGPMADEIGRAVDDIRSGTPAEGALRRLGSRTGVAALGRLVDALLQSVERGSPLADVARAQAADVRAADRRRLLELAGRKDALMLVPIVFLVLPSVVLVAVFPGVLALRLVVP